MIDFISTQFSYISFQLFLISILLFIIGYVVAPTVYYKRIDFLLAYPLWMAKKIEQWSKKEWNPYLLFAFILLLNSVSLFANLLSGIIPLLPFIFAIWTGLNVGVVSYHMLKGQFYFASLFNPVALFELPAAFLAFTMAIQYNLKQLPIEIVAFREAPFGQYLFIFITIVLPLLLVAAIIESWLIKVAQRMERSNTGDENQPDDNDKNGG
ncbi:MAG: hypothetical protein GF313_08530 [Caldithrix sp.]|nr:hypothetical protein [Caldithrix sp.]